LPLLIHLNQKLSSQAKLFAPLRTTQSKDPRLFLPLSLCLCRCRCRCVPSLCCHPERSEGSRRTQFTTTLRTFHHLLCLCFCSFLPPNPRNRHFDRSCSRPLRAAQRRNPLSTVGLWMPQTPLLPKQMIQNRIHQRIDHHHIRRIRPEPNQVPHHLAHPFLHPVAKHLLLLDRQLTQQ